MKQEEEYFEEGEPRSTYRPYESESLPATTAELLGQSILETFARISDPPMIEDKKIRKKIPVILTRTIKDKNGEEKTIEYIDHWEIKEWSFPILVQPKYHELITNDLPRGFLSEGDLEVARNNATYCMMVKSFAERYDLDLSLHHNKWIGETNYLIVSSGAFKGKKVQLAKTNIAETSYRADSVQTIGQARKKKGFIQDILGQ